MKKITVLFLTFAFIFSLQAKILVGTVDIQKVLLAVKEGKKVKSELKATFEKKKKKLKKDEQTIMKMRQDYEKQSLVMSSDAKQKKEMEIQKKIMDIQKISMQYQRELQGLEQELKKPILERIQKIVEEISKREKVDMTFETSTAPVVYAKDQKDITTEVISLYDKRFPAK